MSKELRAFRKICKNLNSYEFTDEYKKNKKLIENELKILDYLKEICLEGKDKYGKGTWGWVEFDLDNHPQLKEWLKDEKHL